MDLRWKAEDLYPRCVIVSPFGRRETVTRTVDDPPFVRVFTDLTGPGYGWRCLTTDRVTALSTPSAAETSPAYAHPEIRVLDLSTAATPRLLAVATDASIEIPQMAGTMAIATRIARGPTWEVTTYPVDSGGSATRVVADKTRARQAVNAHARLHAKALGVAVCHIQEHHRH